MAQVSMTVRMDSALKASFDSLCSEFGMSANTAMNVFAKAVVRSGKIPFEIQSAKSAAESEGMRAFRAIRTLAENGNLPDITLDDINDEIANVRAGR